MSILGRVLSWLLTVLCSIYLLRIPLLTGLGMIALYWAAFFTRAGSILGNGFDVSNFWGLVFVSLAAFLLALVIVVTGRIVKRHGVERFFGTASAETDRYDKWLTRLYYLLIPVALVVVFGAIAGATYTSEILGWPSAFGAGALGLLLFLFAVLVIHVVEVLFTREEVLRGEPSDVFLPTKATPNGPRTPDPEDEPDQQPIRRYIEPLDGFIRTRDPTSWLIQRRPMTWAARCLRKLSGLFPRNVGRGYFEYEDGTDTVLWVRRGHIAALTLLAVTLVFYFLLGTNDFRRLLVGLPPLIPTLCYVLLLAMLVCWGFSSLAFFLDRYRIPTIVPLVALLLVTSLAPWLKSDYYYPALEPVQENAKEESDDNSIVVVATAGGGIQAAVWTARVLTGLEQECRRVCGESFGESIRLISAVSGGSVGTMYFLNEYAGGRLPEDEELQEVVARTERSSLDYVVWGLLYPDLVRLFNVLPLQPAWLGWDRGRALEQAWLREDMAWDNRAGINARLSEWRNDARNGDRPAVIFNTTVAETGWRLALTTTDPIQGRLRYEKLLEGETKTDVSVVTATRLSATFPYASPAARANVEGTAPHLVDGGYYDNYGIVSLVEWLDHELERNADIDRVLVLEIRGAGGGCNIDEQQVRSQEGPEMQDPGKDRGWLYQAGAPLATVLKVRGTAQQGNNVVTLDLLLDKWDKKGEEENNEDVDITQAEFSFDGATPPTSWHLTERQKRDIQDNWKAELDEDCNKREGWSRVKNFLEMR